MISVKRRIEVKNTPTGKRLVVASAAPRPEPPPLEVKVASVARLLALAIHLEGQIRAGAVRDQTALARQLKVTQPRMTQIMNLTLLSPSIQRQVLALKDVKGKRDRVNERRLRRIAGEPCWSRQAEMWAGIGL
jgi:hypothetical protein